MILPPGSHLCSMQKKSQWLIYTVSYIFYIKQEKGNIGTRGPVGCSLLMSSVVLNNDVSLWIVPSGHSLAFCFCLPLFFRHQKYELVEVTVPVESAHPDHGYSDQQLVWITKLGTE